MLRGKNAIITGARSGIGLATVKLFAEYGCNVWALLRNAKDEQFLSSVEELEQKHSVRIKPISVDLSRKESINEAIREVAQEKIPVDILCNIAGTVGANRLFQATPIEDMQAVFDVNFFAPIMLCQLVSRLMARQNCGAIVNVSSIAGIDGDPAQLEYSASKAALICSTKKMAKELAVYGIRVNSVAPGLTDTQMLNSMADEVKDKEIYKSLLKRQAKPREIAEAIAFLASDKAGFINAQTIRVDGGIV